MPDENLQTVKLRDFLTEAQLHESFRIIRHSRNHAMKDNLVRYFKENPDIMAAFEKHQVLPEYFAYALIHMS